MATPFCSCGTTAVVLSMMAASVPWAPVVAFMVASPLTSPDELFLSAGLFGWPFALTFFVGSVVLGLVGGIVAFVAERAGVLEGQARFAAPTSLAAPAFAAPALAAAALADPVIARAETSARSAGGSCCASPRSASPLGIGPGAANVAEFDAIDRWRLRAFAGETWQMARVMVPLFLGFAMIGYAIVALIPTAWITTLLGGSNPLSIVLAATLGIPFYISTEASLPLVASLMHGGLGAGPAMAFLVTGAGTSAAAIAGGLLIARWRCSRSWSASCGSARSGSASPRRRSGSEPGGRGALAANPSGGLRAANLSRAHTARDRIRRGGQPVRSEIAP